MACSSGCPTPGAHQSWGECLRAKNLRTSALTEASGVSATQQKKADRSLDLYESARKQGIQPKSTRPADVRRALDISDKTGTAYQA